MVQQGLIFLGLIVLLIFIGLPVYFYLRYRNINKAWESLKQNFGFEEESSYSLKGSWNGETFTIVYHPGNRYERASITVSLSCSFENMPNGTLRTERWWDKLGKASGLAKEFQSLSNEFNDSIYVASDDKRFEKLIRSSSFRRIAASLIENRFSKVQISQNYNSGEIEWKTVFYHGFWNRLISPSYLKKVLSSLIDLKDQLHKKGNISSLAPYESGKTPHPSKLLSLIGGGLPVVSIVFGFVLFLWGTYYPTFTYQLHFIGLKIAGAGLLAYLPIGYLCFRGHSKSHKEFFAFLMCASFGFPLLIISMLITTNGFMDESSSVWHKGEPINLRYDKGEYYVTVKTIHNGIQGEPELEITEQIYDQLKDKNEVLIKVKDGFLSEPWVDELKIKN